MAKELLNIMFDTETKQMMVGGLPMNNEQEKLHVLEMLISALNIMIHLKPAVIQPATHIPGIPPINGKPPVRMTN